MINMLDIIFLKVRFSETSIGVTAVILYPNR